MRRNKTRLKLILLSVALVGFISIADFYVWKEYHHALISLLWAIRALLIFTAFVIFREMTRRLDRLVSIIEESGDFVSWATVDGKVRYINRSGLELCGMVVGKKYDKLISEMHPPWAADIIMKKGIPYAKEHGTWKGTTAVLTTDGREIPVSQTIISQQSNGNTYLATIMRDISRVHAERETLKRMVSEMKTIIDNGVVGFAVVNGDGNVVYINDIGANILKGSKEKLVGVKFGYTLDTPSTQTVVQVCDDDGRLSEMELEWTPVQWSGVSMKLAMFRDVGEKKKIVDLNKELKEARKRETASIIAGGVAHDLNNILTSITGLPELIAKRTTDERSLEMLEHIRRSADCAAVIVSDMNMISSPTMYALDPLRLTDVVNAYNQGPELAKLTKKHSNVSVEVVNNCPSSCGIDGSHSHLYKLLMNVVKNAMESIPPDQKGKVRIGVERLVVNETIQGVFTTSPPGCYVVLSVTDNGTGVERGNIHKLFDAFFSCHKATRNGLNSGLGLTVVKSVADRHNATIRVHSVHGEGTEFSFFFPEVPYQRQEKVLDNVDGYGTIGVLDDMEDQLFVIRAVLQDLGYDVVTAQTVDELLEEAKNKAFDVLMVDARLNGQGSGVNAWRKFRKEHPDQVGLIFSGNLTTEIEEEATEAGIVGFVNKPIKRYTLGKALIKALGDRR